MPRICAPRQVLRTRRSLGRVVGSPCGHRRTGEDASRGPAVRSRRRGGLRSRRCRLRRGVVLVDLRLRARRRPADPLGWHGVLPLSPRRAVGRGRHDGTHRGALVRGPHLGDGGRQSRSAAQSLPRQVSGRRGDDAPPVLPARRRYGSSRRARRPTGSPRRIRSRPLPPVSSTRWSGLRSSASCCSGGSRGLRS